MSKEKSPAFQYYPKDLLTDVNYLMMNYSQRGMYWHLVSICWLEGSIPCDPQSICEILQIPFDLTFEQGTYTRLARCFRQHPLDITRFVHPRLELERAKQARHRELSALGGKRSAHKRKHPQQKSQQQGTCISVPPNVNPPSSSPISYLQSSTAVQKRERRTKLSYFCPEDFQLTPEDLEWARSERPDVDAERETKRFRLHEYKVPKSNWKSAWKNWILGAGNGAAPTKPVQKDTVGQSKTVECDKEAVAKALKIRQERGI